MVSVKTTLVVPENFDFQLFHRLKPGFQKTESRVPSHLATAP